MTKAAKTPDNSGIVPFVHSNGTSREELVSQLEVGWDAIKAAYDALRHSAPNARDYYVDPGRMDKALAQHRRRQLVLQELQDEIEAEIEAIERAGR